MIIDLVDTNQLTTKYEIKVSVTREEATEEKSEEKTSPQSNDKEESKPSKSQENSPTPSNNFIFDASKYGNKSPAE